MKPVPITDCHRLTTAATSRAVAVRTWAGGWNRKPIEH